MGDQDVAVGVPPEATMLYAHAEYVACVERLRACSNDASFVLRLRCLNRVGSPEALSADVIARAALLPEVLRLQAFTQIANAYHRARMPKRADAYMAAAYALLDRCGSCDERAELHYSDAVRHWARGEYAEAQKLLAPLFALSAWRPYALALRGWIHAARGEFSEQLQSLLDAFETTDGSDVWARAVILQSTADLAWELYHPALACRVSAIAATLSWSSGVRTQEFYTFRSLALCAALSGHWLRAYDLLLRAERVASEQIAHRVMVLADKASLAHEIGQIETAREHLAALRNLAEDVPWQDVADGRIALVNVCTLWSRIGEAEEAERLWQQYRAIGTPIPPVFSYGLDDRRLHAMERYAEGLLLRTNGERRASARAIAEAHEVWNAGGYRWRAAVAAIDLAELTGAGRYIEETRSLRAIFPNAWFVRALPESDVAREPLWATLHGTKRIVAFEVANGKRTKQIAHDLSLSPHTVRNTVAQLFDCFDVQPRTRATLACRLRSPVA